MSIAEPTTGWSPASLVEVWVDGPARTLVIPMYRESARIEATIAELASSLLNEASTEIIFVDDGSDDDTSLVARRALAAHRMPGFVLRLERNIGKGGAVRAGMLSARGRTVAFTDADLSTPPAEIERCFVAIEHGADVALASRGAARSIIAVKQPALRQLSGRAFNLLVRQAGLTTWRDTQCGLKAFSRSAARHLFGSLQTRGFAFDVEVLFRASQAGLSIVEVPVEWHHVDSSRVRPVRDGVSMFREVRRLKRALAADPSSVAQSGDATVIPLERTLVLPAEA